MKQLLQAMCLAVLVGLAAVANQPARTSGDDVARAVAVRLFESLSDEQKQIALKPFDDKERLVEDFPAGNRPGLPVSKLTPEQKALVEEAIRATTSEYGASRCLEVLKQTGEAKRWVNFFGNPKPGERFAWRLVVHHLTLVYAEYGKDPAREFGPILLGGNPVNQLWAEEEELALALFAALSPEEQQAVKATKGGGGSGAPIGMSGAMVKDLNAKARDLAKSLVQKRAAVLSADRQKVLLDLIESAGGIDNLRLAYWGQPDKGHLDGGNYSWKIGNQAVQLDWQTVGKNHIHMSLRVRPK